MQARLPIRPLLVCVAVLVAGSAMAQGSDKDRATPASKQSATRSTPAAKPAAAAKRLDFVPSGSVKETSTRPESAPAPAKDGSFCDHGSASDA